MSVGAFRGLLGPIFEPIFKPILRPVTRLLVGLIAIPLFRLFRRKVVRIHELDAELEKDIDQWFRGALLLLIASANVEPWLFPWSDVGEWRGEKIIVSWITLTLRLMVAIGVIEGMPDQMLFTIIHPGMSRVKFQRGLGLWRNLWREKKNIVLGLVCHHLNRSSPIFAILPTFVDGGLGWLFYFMAITQYLIIGLVTSRDRAADVLSEFDMRVAERRRELLQELDLPADHPAVRAEPDRATRTLPPETSAGEQRMTATPRAAIEKAT